MFSVIRIIERVYTRVKHTDRGVLLSSLVQARALGHRLRLAPSLRGGQRGQRHLEEVVRRRVVERCVAREDDRRELVGVAHRPAAACVAEALPLGPVAAIEAEIEGGHL